MNLRSRLARRQTTCAVVLSLALAIPAAAQTVGSSNTATADPTVPRPHTTPCTVQLFTNLEFANFDPKPFTYTPPAACPGPWAKVVLEADFSVTTGRQFDRTAEIALGHVNIYFGTTAEPSSTVSPSWHVERDLTDYSPLFRAAQAGDVNLGNLVNETYTGIIHGSAVLKFYTTPTRKAPRVADLVLPFSDAPGGTANLNTTANVLEPTFNLPANVENAYLDVITQSQSGDEFWFTCVPNDVANELFSCGGTSFREAQVTIDGHPAGVAPVYPWIFTGGIDPLLWRPIPSVQTLNFVPYRVDLTPFAGVLSDGQPHKVGVSVFNANNYFAVAASLLVYLDHGSSHVTGAVTQNTIGTPQPSVVENLATAADGTITGTVTTTSARHFVVAGYVNTSHGRVDTKVLEDVQFSNKQDFIVAAAQYVQKINQSTTVSSATVTKQGRAVTQSGARFSYPLNLTIEQDSNADGSFSLTTTSDQKFDSQSARVGPGQPSFSLVSNEVNSKDTLLFNAAGAVTGYQDRSSSQTYSSLSSASGCYQRTITSASGVLTSVTDGCGH
jgi:hypothetical protein